MQFLKSKAPGDSSWIFTVHEEPRTRVLDKLTVDLDAWVWEEAQWIIQAFSSGDIRLLIHPRLLFQRGLKPKVFEMASLLGKLVLLYGAVPDIRGEEEGRFQDIVEEFLSAVRKDVRPKVIRAMGAAIQSGEFSTSRELLSLWREHLANQGKHIRGSQLLEVLDNIILA